MSIVRMRYSAYKKHYADCKTIYGSYDERAKTIEVSIPEGRMKPSGTRGESFCFFPGMMAKDSAGNVVNLGGFRAITWDNACKQIRRLGYEPLTDWELREYEAACAEASSRKSSSAIRY